MALLLASFADLIGPSESPDILYKLYIYIYVNKYVNFLIICKCLYLYKERMRTTKVRGRPKRSGEELISPVVKLPLGLVHEGLLSSYGSIGRLAGINM